MDKNELIKDLKVKIIEYLSLEDFNPDDMDENAQLFGEGLGLDSIDALELVMLMEKEYNIKISDMSEGIEIFKSITSMADHIIANQ